jgi:hypothetical protein
MAKNQVLFAVALAAMALSALCVFVAGPPAAKARQPSGWSAGFAAVSTPDATGYAEWWRANLGFETLHEGASPDGQTRFALIQRGRYLIEIVERSGAEPAPALADPSFRHGVFKIGVVVDDLDALERDLRGRDVVFNHGIVRSGQSGRRTFAVRDGDGNVVQFFER